MASPIQKLLDLSQTMLAHARQESWDALAEIETQRHAIWDAYFADATLSDVATAELLLIEQLLAIEKELLVATQAAHGACSEQLQQLRSNQKANKAYQNLK